MRYKKLDEVMELLSDELDGFNKSILKLEKLTQNVDNINIKADTSNIEYCIQDHLRTEKEKSQKLHEAFQRMEKQLSKSQVVPKIQLWLHYSMYMICLIIIGYLVFKLK